jgi:prepilin-type N-terminal cleavage/methylation domain-containing protein
LHRLIAPGTAQPAATNHPPVAFGALGEKVSAAAARADDETALSTERRSRRALFPSRIPKTFGEVRKGGEPSPKETLVNRHRAFTLTELLVSLGIVAVLLGMLCPAVQQVREAANRVACASNLKQIGLAAHNYHAAAGRFPDAGHSTRTSDWECGWLHRLAPFFENNLTREQGAGNYVQKILFCPSRRAPGLDTFVDDQGQPYTAAGNDYAGSMGTTMWSGDWNAPTTVFTPCDHTDGLIAPRLWSYPPYRLQEGNGPGVPLTQVSAGSSNVLLAAEKRMDVLLVGQRQAGEGNDWTWGDDGWQTIRVTACPPARDWRDGRPDGGGGWDRGGAFGSAHAAGLNCLAGDGSVRFVVYTVAPAVWLHFGQRAVGTAETP